MPSRVDAQRAERYLALRRAGYDKTAAARRAGVSRGWARTYEQHLRNNPADQCPLCGRELTSE